MKLVFLGTGAFAAPILEAIKTKTDWQVLGVLGKKDSQKKALKKSPDIIITADYGRIIPAEVFNAPPLKTVNVHPSLLPEYRGPSPIQRALLEGRTETGVTLMLIDEELDHGPIISQEEVTVAPNDIYTTLETKLAKIGAEMIIRDIPQYVSGKLEPVTQDHSKATFTKLIKKEDGNIDWNSPAQHIYNRWRAFIRWPGIFSFWKGRRFNLIEIRTEEREFGGKIGILNAQNGRLFVKCGEGLPAGQAGAVEVLRIQPEGKRPMSAGEFINGYRSVIIEG